MLPNLVPLSVAVFWILNSWFKDWLLGSSWPFEEEKVGIEKLETQIQEILETIV
jgi:hypothetical protein